MALLSASNLSKYYGADEVFSGISLDVNEGDCIALVGPNGCGKSTLLELLSANMEPDEGTMHRSNDMRLGYLPQKPDFESDSTLWEAMEAVFSELLEQRSELRKLEQEMASEDDHRRDMAISRYGPMLEAFEHAGGFFYETRIAQVLSGLGFSKDEFQSPIAHLSGGQKTRALLARLLLETPDLLLLDEPTNHLDLEGIEWLESQLKNWQGAVVVVAHDRAFLDTIAERIWELEYGKMQAYRGNYTAYVMQRAERHRQQMVAYKRQEKQIARTEEYIQRYMAGQRSAQAKGRLKRLEREERLQRPKSRRSIHVDLQTTLRSGDLVLGLYDLQVGYNPAVPLVNVEEAEIHRGQCVALIGPNGAGKTTLLRTILRQIRPLDGHIRVGAAVRLGYFAQVQAELVPERTLVETLFGAGMTSLAETRALLARYGFRGDDVFKQIRVLSGGERARIALILLSLQKANFLLLDEPTNHLDITSQEILQDVIVDFNGTILLVSHDRYLIREIATHIWVIDDQQLRIFNEGYAEYTAWHREKQESATGDQKRADPERARREAERQAKRERERVLARQQKRLEELETQIGILEARMQTLTTSLDVAGRAQDVDRVTKLGAEYHKVEAEINRLLEEWANVAENPAS